MCGLKMLACATALVAGASATAPNCSNPVFIDELFGAPSLALVLGQPQPHPKGADLPCQAFNNKDSCCTNETLFIIGEVFSTGQELINAVSEAISTNDYPSELAALVSAQMTIVCAAASIFPQLASACNSAASILTQYTKELTQAADDVVQAELQCARGLSNYLKGVLCFACEANWDQYLVHDAENVISALDINQQTCDSIVDDCGPVNTAVANLAVTAVNLVNAVTNELTSSQWPGLNININTIKALPDTCGGTLGSPGDCTSFYCDNIVSGMTGPSQANWGAPAAALQARLLEVVAASATSSVNVYTSNGYPAYAVGAADYPQGLAGWAVALIVIVVVGVVVAGAVVGVIAVQRRRGAAKSISRAYQATTTSTTAGDYGALKTEGR
jgi:hypothetical protein